MDGPNTGAPLQAPVLPLWPVHSASRAARAQAGPASRGGFGGMPDHVPLDHVPLNTPGPVALPPPPPPPPARQDPKAVFRPALGQALVSLQCARARISHKHSNTRICLSSTATRVHLSQTQLHMHAPGQTSSPVTTAPLLSARRRGRPADAAARAAGAPRAREIWLCVDWPLCRGCARAFVCTRLSVRVRCLRLGARARRCTGRSSSTRRSP